MPSPSSVDLGPQRHQDADQLQQHERHRAAVEDRRAHGDRLNPQLAGVAEQDAVGHAAPRLLGEDARQQRAHRAAHAVRRDDVEASRQGACGRGRPDRSSSESPRCRPAGWR